MKLTIALDIDVTKIEKQRIYVSNNTGKKYLNCVAFIDTEQKNQYGDHGMIVQSVRKQERDKGVKGPILGNARVINSDVVKPGAQQSHDSDVSDYDDEIPF